MIIEDIPCKPHWSLGYKIVLVNSNPATIMTDPSINVTYAKKDVLAEYNVEVMGVNIDTIEREEDRIVLRAVQTGLISLRSIGPFYCTRKIIKNTMTVRVYAFACGILQFLIN